MTKKRPTPSARIAKLEKTVVLCATATVKLAGKVKRLEAKLRKQEGRVITGFSDARGEMIPMEDDE